MFATMPACVCVFCFDFFFLYFDEFDEGGYLPQMRIDNKENFLKWK